METRNQNSRLEVHEQQIKQLQSDVAEIKQLMTDDRTESSEFRKVMLAWIKQYEKKPESSSSGSDAGPTLVDPFHTPPFDSSHHSSPLPWAVKKVKLPEFSGFDPQGWIKKVNLYFDINQIPDDLRLKLAQLSMQGVAQHWFTMVTQVHDSMSWTEFQTELLQRFSRLEIHNPYEQLATIKQASSILDYIDGFEYLLSLVPRLPESQTIGYFVAGLRNDVKQWVRLHRSQTRLDAIYLATDVEAMLRPQSNDTPLARYRYADYGGMMDEEEVKVGENWMMTALPPPPPTDNSDPPSGVCQVLEVMGCCNQLSGTQTLQLEGTLLGIPICLLVDSGATHNFISKRLVTALAIASSPVDGINIRLGDGHVVVTTQCQGLSIQLGPCSFLINALVFDTGTLDLILGMEWLQSLGQVTHDWKNSWMKFVFQDASIVLQGSGKSQPNATALQNWLRVETKPQLISLTLDTSPTSSRTPHPLTMLPLVSMHIKQQNYKAHKFIKHLCFLRQHHGHQVMASKSTKGGRRDPAWKYSEEIEVPAEGAKKGYKYVKCNFCYKVITGGVQRMKAHLACTHKNVILCPQVPQEVKDEIREFLKQFETSKFNFQRNFEETIDAGAYFVSVAGGSGSGDSCPSVQRGVRGPMNRFVNSMDDDEREGPIASEKMTPTMAKEQRNKVCLDIGRFFYENGIPFNVATSLSFNSMLRSVGNYGRGLNPPTMYELRTRILQEVKTIETLVNDIKATWKSTGVSLLSDGWSDMRNRSLINFLANNPHGTVFLKTVDASDCVKNAEKLFELLDGVVEEIGEDIVVQVMTDNASAYKAAGALLMEKRKTLYWTPCVAHCIDLMLKKIVVLGQRNQMEKRLKKEIMDERSFWPSVVYSLKTTKPLVEVLRIVNGERSPAMAFIYGAMDECKEKIAKNFDNQLSSYKEIWDIIDQKWENQMHRDLHAAAYYLNPRFRWSPNVSEHQEIKRGLYNCMDRFVKNDDVYMKIEAQLDDYKYKSFYPFIYGSCAK
ncbi:hypothetical protein E3N88_12048 [Mikania micrantha]|uniref:BED-type domain-containing protein n=1 Tax=Mikania micrantha TaxID=192012 RepID=A0A5N6P4I7_9ASTR|nr:hypothetical protein E3N88_12048 [Mikania micrantha]